MNNETYENSIAVIGISCRFPGAKNIHEYWENISNGVDSISNFSDEELRQAGIPDELINDPSYIKSKGVLEDIELFDADFFGINNTEASITDPQHKLFLEFCWQALEDAGYSPDRSHGSIGVYGGVGVNSYFLNNIFPNKALQEKVGNYLIHLANEKDYLTTKVSYALNLKGPSLNIQTACSTSLVTVCEACNDLLTYQCDIALAGGLGISVPQTAGYLHQEGMIFSSDGRCRPFDNKASGTVVGSGGGVVVLKRLEDALRDQDHIYGLIRGYGVNNDGSRKIGFSAPSIEGQAEAISAAMAMASISPETISYVEAHGTGTFLGDPIEIQGLTLAFQEYTTKKQYCAIGSVKGNIGHLMEGSGIAGFIKALLALKNKSIPPSIHCDTPNTNIDFKNTPFYVNTTLAAWTTKNTPRRAGVSAFGMGGTNAHVILEEAPFSPLSPAKNNQHLLVLSAKTPTALQKMAQNLGVFLQNTPSISLSHLAYTLQLGRKGFDYRKTFVVSSLPQAVSALIEFDKNESSTTNLKPSTQKKTVCFVICKTPAEVNLGLDLYQQIPFYRKTIDECAELLEDLIGINIKTILYPTDENKEFADNQIKTPLIANCISFITGYSIAKLWEQWGVYPNQIVNLNHDLILSACLSSAFSLEKTLKLLVSKQLSPSEFNPLKTPIFSYHNHKWMECNKVIPIEVWQQSLLDEAPLLLSDAPLNDPNNLFIEIGTQSFFTSSCTNVFPSLANSHGKDNYATLLTSLGRLWSAGVLIDWTSFTEDNACQKLSLPTYPFEKKRYWIDPIENKKTLPLTNKVDLLCHASEIESQLLELWKDFLGPCVGIHDNFNHLGGDSILAIQMASKINDIFGINIGINSLLEYPTIAELSKMITKKTQEQKTKKDTLCSNLVEFKPSDQGLPLFLIHPIGGHVFCYQPLVDNFSYNGPIYGIESIHPLNTIEKTASFYIEVIQSIQPHGPYHILGFSFGGLIAYEIARQLTERNHSIHLLCLLDIIKPGTLPLTSDTSSMLLNLIELFTQQKTSIEEIMQLSYQEKIIRLAHSLHLETLPFVEQEKIFHTITTHWEALVCYEPKPYRGKVLFFEAADRFTQRKDLSMASTWIDLVKDQLEVHEVAGNHLSMLSSAHIKNITTILECYLKKEIS